MLIEYIVSIGGEAGSIKNILIFEVYFYISIRDTLHTHLRGGGTTLAGDSEEAFRVALHHHSAPSLQKTEPIEQNVVLKGTCADQRPGWSLRISVENERTAEEKQCKKALKYVLHPF